MSVINLSDYAWELCGWRPFSWQLSKSMETGARFNSDLGPYPAVMPGSVQATLLREGVLPDWHVGMQSRECEWVEHRHWDYSVMIPEGALTEGEKVILEAPGLDYSGWILVDAKIVAEFKGALLPHRFDLSKALGDGKSHQLSILFDEAPQEQGQIGFTIRSHVYKPRYNYSWDWCPRFVPVGIVEPMSLRTGVDAMLTLTRVDAWLESDSLDRGEIRVTLDADGCEDIQVEVEVWDGDRSMGGLQVIMRPGLQDITLGDLPVELWWPNGEGEQKLYDVVIRTVGEQPWEQRRRVGFRRVEWRKCEGAPRGAEPWICVVNDRPVFLQGVNWTPLRVDYPDTTGAEYRQVLDIYHDMGCTCFRIWGGAFLETELFYDLCDEAGILVWQEFPLSSSGIDNTPPDSPDSIAELLKIARSYIERRCHHASLFMWCGGNELTTPIKPEAPGVTFPVDYSFACIAALRDLVAQEDPARRFVATSPTGPHFYAQPADYGRGLHHDVHGPWGFMNGAFADMDAWREYWRADDSLFRSEVGMPGAQDEALTERYSGGNAYWPPEGEYWRHTAAWWTQWQRLREEMDGAAFADYVARTQADQAEAYRIAAAQCRRRFPKCGGFIVWHGHDCFPCPANNSIIDFDRKPKPACHALREVFRTAPKDLPKV